MHCFVFFSLHRECSRRSSDFKAVVLDCRVNEENSILQGRNSTSLSNLQTSKRVLQPMTTTRRHSSFLGQSDWTSDERTFRFDLRHPVSNRRSVSMLFGRPSLLFFALECYRYSVFLFRNIDRNNSGSIRFEDLAMTFSLLIYGSIEDRLTWIFDLYDLNKDGKLTRMVRLTLGFFPLTRRRSL